MPNIKRITAGSLAKSNKVNQLIKKLNALENMTVRQGEGEEQPALNVADNNSELITTPGGGLPDGYEELDVVICQNGAPLTGKILFNQD
jgi:hypothetical protein